MGMAKQASAAHGHAGGVVVQLQTWEEEDL
jgi:hypothetical protein